MPFDGNGNYVLPTPAYPAVTGTVIEAADWNTVNTDIQAALSKSITRDGQSPALADLSMGGFRLKALAAAALADDAMRYDQRYAAVGGPIAKNAYTTPIAVAAAPTTTINTAGSNIFTITLNQNITLALNPSNPDGQTISIRFVEDATGGRFVTLPSNVKVAGVLDTTAGHVTWLTLTYTSVAGQWEGAWMVIG